MSTGHIDQKIHCARNYPPLIIIGGFTVLFFMISFATPVEENDKYIPYLVTAIGYLILALLYVRLDFYDDRMELVRPFLLGQKRTIAYTDISHITFEHIDAGRNLVFNPVKIHSLKIGAKPRKVYIDLPGKFYTILNWLRTKGVTVAGRDEQNILTGNLDRIWDSYKWPKE